MFYRHPLQLLLNHRRLIIFSGLGIAIVTLGISLFLPMEYRADSQVLIQYKSNYGVDPYTVVKSAERIGDSMVEIMKTSDFYSKVISRDGYQYDKTQFQNLVDRLQRKKWQKNVKSGVVYGTGILNISAYQPKPEQAKQLASAVMDTLVDKAWEYVGADVTLKIINQPVATRYPARPNLVVNTVVGFVVGMFISSLVILRRG